MTMTLATLVMTSALLGRWYDTYGFGPNPEVVRKIWKTHFLQALELLEWIYHFAATGTRLVHRRRESTLTICVRIRCPPQFLCIVYLPNYSAQITFPHVSQQHLTWATLQAHENGQKKDVERSKDETKYWTKIDAIIVILLTRVRYNRLRTANTVYSRTRGASTRLQVQNRFPFLRILTERRFSTAYTQFSDISI